MAPVSQYNNFGEPIERQKVRYLCGFAPDSYPSLHMLFNHSGTTLQPIMIRTCVSGIFRFCLRLGVLSWVTVGKGGRCGGGGYADWKFWGLRNNSGGLLGRLQLDLLDHSDFKSRILSTNLVNRCKIIALLSCTMYRARTRPGNKIA